MQALVLATTAAIAWQKVRRGDSLFFFPLPELPPLEIVARGWRAAWRGYAGGYLYVLRGGAVFLALALSFLAFGRAALRRILPDPGIGAAEILGFSYLLGFLISGTAWFALAQCGWLRPAAAISLAVLGAVCFLLQARRARPSFPLLQRSFLVWKASVPKSHSALLVAFAVFVSYTALNAYLPQDYPDTLQVDLTLVHYYMAEGRLVANPFETYTYFPQTWWLVLSWPLLLGSEMAASLLLWGLNAAFLTLAWGFLRRRAGEVAALLALWLAGTCLIYNWLSVTMKNDLAVAVFLFAHYAALFEALELQADQPGKSGRWALLSGLLCGGAVAFKWTALAACLPSAFALLVSRGARDALRAGSPLALWLAGAALSAGPWLLRTLILTGNPVYPYLGGLFPASLLQAWHHPTRMDPVAAFQGWKNYIATASGAQYTPDVLPSVWGPSILFLLLAPAAGRAPALRFTIAAAAATSAAIAWYSPMLRYLLGPLLFLALTALGFSFRALDESRKPAAFAVSAFVLLACFYQTTVKSSFFRRSAQGAQGALSGFSPANAMTRDETLDNLRWMAHWINTRTAPDDKVLFVGSNYACWLRRRFAYSGPAERELGAFLSEPCRDAEELKRKLTAMGFRHVLLCPQRLRQKTREEVPGLRLEEAEIAKWEALTRTLMGLRLVSPNAEFRWYTFLDAEPRPIAIRAHDVESVPRMTHHYARALYASGRLEEAEKIGQTLLGVHAAPGLRSAVYSLLGWIRYRQGRLREGEEMMAAGIAELPERAEPYAAAAGFYAAVGKKERAESLLAAASKRAGP